MFLLVLSKCSLGSILTMVIYGASPPYHLPMIGIKMLLMMILSLENSDDNEKMYEKP